MFNNNQHINYSKADIEKYLQGKMTNAERNALEKAALIDPFLADAIEGYELANTETANKVLEDTRQLITNSNTIQPTYNLANIEEYINGSMTGLQRNSFEKACLKDAFLADALEGFTNAQLDVAKTSLYNITNVIIGEKKVETRVITMKTNNKQWLKIAAAILLMVGVGSTIWWANKKQLAVENPIAQLREEVKTASEAPILNNPSNTKPTTTLENKTNSELKKPLLENAIAKINLDTTYQEKAAIVSADAIKEQVETTAKAPTEKPPQQKSIAAKVEDEKNKQETTDRELSAKSNAANNSNNQRDDRKYNNPSLNNDNNRGNNNLLNEVKGKVENNNGEPIVGATINIKDRGNKNINATVTDQAGNFSIKVADTTAVAAIQSVGYDQQKINLSTNRSNNIILQTNDKNLDDVVVVGSTTQKKKSLTGSSTTISKKGLANNSPEPVGGWASFNDYMHKQIIEILTLIRLNTENNNDVVIEFKVDKLGKPYNINAKGSNNDSLNEKAIELIKNGPKWTTDNKSKKVKVVVPFNTP